MPLGSSEHPHFHLVKLTEVQLNLFDLFCPCSDDVPSSSSMTYCLVQLRFPISTPPTPRNVLFCRKPGSWRRAIVSLDPGNSEQPTWLIALLLGPRTCSLPDALRYEPTYPRSHHGLAPRSVSRGVLFWKSKLGESKPRDSPECIFS